jgi:hypothetical protein
LNAFLASFPNDAALAYSFMLHSIGIKLLYSSEVNTNYYVNNKPKIKKELAELKNEGLTLLKTACFQTLYIILRDIYKSSDLANDQVSLDQTVKKECSELQKKINPDIFVNYAQTIIDKIALTNSTRNFQASELEKINGHITDELIQHIGTKIAEFTPKILFIAEYTFCQGMTNLILRILKDENLVLSNQKFNSPTKNAQRTYQNTIVKYNYILPKTFIALISLADFWQQNGRINAYDYILKNAYNLLPTFLEDIKNLQHDNYVNCVLDFINPELFSTLDIMFLFKQEYQQLVSSRYIKNRFVNTLVTKLNFLLNSRTRRTLGNHCEFDPSGFISFFSHVRLSNRSQTREIKNYRSLSSLEAKTFYPKESMYRVWSLFSSKALERLGVFSGNQKGSRKDMVDSAGSYQEISNVLKGYKDYFNTLIPNFIEDSLIATWIKEIIRGENRLTKIDEEFAKMMYEQSKIDKLKEKLVGIAYLLFGCEVARNPASIPIHYMMLELIINNRLNFEDALTATSNNNLSNGGRMPMSAKGAIAAGRRLNNKFAQYLPCTYSYPGNEKDSEVGILDPEMISREVNILYGWLSLKIGPDIVKQKDILYFFDYIMAEIPKNWT